MHAILKVKAMYILMIIIIITDHISTIIFTTSTSTSTASSAIIEHKKGIVNHTYLPTKEEVQITDIVCSNDDLPEEMMEGFDDCTNILPVYKRLSLLERCRSLVFRNNETANQMRKLLCTDRQLERKWETCKFSIRLREGRNIPDITPYQAMDFVFCMKSVALEQRYNSNKTNYIIPGY